MKLTTAQNDRACGVLLATAAGDALGAPYEFQPARGPELPVEMVGGGSFGWEPGEWTDDTSMAIAIAEIAATGADLRDTAAHDAIVRRWVAWAKTATDVGIQTRAVLSRVDDSWPAASAREYAQRQFEQGARSAGNGSLMRTAPVALAYLTDATSAGEQATVEAAIAISDLTHADPETAEACVIWCVAIRYAVLTGELDVRRGLRHLADDRAQVWAERLDDAEGKRPSDFSKNGWVVGALQSAWSAISGTPIPENGRAGDLQGEFRADHLHRALDAAVRCGHDTDTVAAIAGGLLGALHGASAVPAAWRRVLHGWPGLRARDLIVLTERTLRQDRPDTFDYTYRSKGDLSARAVHPLDDGVRLGAIGALRPLDAYVDAVVSLCRIGDDDVPADAEQIEVRLIDTPDPDANRNLGFVLRDTVEVLQTLRAEGKTVLLHCVQAQSRTPTVAALYGAAISGEPATDVLRQLDGVLPEVNPNRTFRSLITGHQA
ncbi:ADP-ribosylglycohydrolase family protein [Nakamurella sp. A5-74]|uniref:ADP-ribosylglycohydrolase family protein n=1 Tax=Nakamurella sp. A5-74 TaxID=3158264 RepID=A0AAU8DPR1_9ACTN